MKYMTLDQRGTVQAEYIWIDAVGGCRSKTKVSTFLPFTRLSSFMAHACGVGRVLDCDEGPVVIIAPSNTDKPCAR